MASAEDTILTLPDYVVGRSRGFSLDIGGSIAKVFYRSKDEYEGGKRKDKEQGESGVHMVNFQRDDIESVIKLLKEKCDITRDEKGQADIYTTGFGGSLYKKKLEEALNVKINNKDEFTLFVLAFQGMVKNLPADKIFLPLDEEALKFADMMNNIMGMLQQRTGAEPGLKMRGFEYVRIPHSYTLPDNLEDIFPCLLVLAGSGNPFLVVEKDGTSEVCDFPVLGGRFMLGFSKLCCGVETFKEMEELIAKSNKGLSCDAFPPDLVPVPPTPPAGEQSPPTAAPPSGEKKPDEKDMYATLIGGMQKEGLATKWRVFPFGKATIPGFKEASKGDLLYSMQRSVAETIAQSAFTTSFQVGVKNIFFAGNFVSTLRVREFITEIFHMQNLKQKPETRRNFRFIRNGGHLGAIGGYLFQKEH